MSRENPGEDLGRFHLYLDKDDTEWYKSFFGNTVGLSKAIRGVLRDYRLRIEAQAAQGAKRVEMPADLKGELMATISKDTGA